MESIIISKDPIRCKLAVDNGIIQVTRCKVSKEETWKVWTNKMIPNENQNRNLDETSTIKRIMRTNEIKTLRTIKEVTLRGKIRTH